VILQNMFSISFSSTFYLYMSGTQAKCLQRVIVLQKSANLQLNIHPYFCSIRAIGTNNCSLVFEEFKTQVLVGIVEAVHL